MRILSYRFLDVDPVLVLAGRGRRSTSRRSPLTFAGTRLRTPVELGNLAADDRDLAHGRRVVEPHRVVPRGHGRVHGRKDRASIGAPLRDVDVGPPRGIVV